MRKLSPMCRVVLRSSVLAISLVLVSTVGAYAQDDSFQFGEGRFEISGKKPAGFTEFRYLYLEGGTVKAGAGKTLAASSSESVKGEMYGRQKFRIKTGRIDGDKLTFETAAVKGVSFRFDGQVSNYYPNSQNVISPRLSGTLTKLSNGKQTATARVTFGHLEPEF